MRSCRLLFITLILLLSGCAVKFIYNQLDWLIPWYLDDYVSLNSSQEKLFQERLQSYLDWHRKQQLPVYADFLDWVAMSSENGLSLKEIDELQARIEDLSAQLFARLAPALQDSFADLSDEQVTELFANLEQENEDYVEQFIETPEHKQRRKRVREVRKFIERWTGTLDEEQMKLIQLWSQDYALMGAEFMQSRVAWQQRLRYIMQRRDERSYLEQALHEIFSTRRRIRTQEYEKKLRENENLLKQLYLQLDKSLTQKQRSRMISKLKNYAADFRELSRQSRMQAPLTEPD